MIEIAFSITGVLLLVLLRRPRRRGSPELDTARLAPPEPAALTLVQEETPERELNSETTADTLHTPELILPDHEALARVIESTPELRALYASLGYAPELEQQAASLLQEAMALIETTLPDFAAFRRTVLQVQAQLDAPAPEQGTAAVLWQARHQKARTDALWQAVLVAGEERTQVLALLNGKAVFTPLPFIEQVPFLSHGQVLWRTPVEVPGLCKRPRDVPHFVTLLDHLAALLASPGVAWHEPGRQEALHELARVRRDLQRPNGYLPTSLQTLQKKMMQCMQQAPFPTAHAQRTALERCLRLCLAVQQTYGWEHRRPLSDACLAHLRGLTQQQAQYYLHTAWMHTPWLTTRLLTNLLDAELAAVPPAVWQQASSPAEALALIRAEVASGLYDPGETLRRLRQCEERGLYVHSLAYPLLRLQPEPGVSPQLPCVAV